MSSFRNAESMIRTTTCMTFATGVHLSVSFKRENLTNILLSLHQTPRHSLPPFYSILVDFPASPGPHTVGLLPDMHHVHLTVGLVQVHRSQEHGRVGSWRGGRSGHQRASIQRIGEPRSHIIHDRGHPEVLVCLPFGSTAQ